MDKLDRIVLTQNDFHNLFHWRDNHKEYVRAFKPVLTEGIIYIGKHYVQIFQDVEGIVTHKVYRKIGEELIHVYTLVWNRETGRGVPTYNNILYNPILKSEERKDYNASIISIHASLMAYMEYYGDKKEYVKVDVKRSGGATNKRRKKGKGKNKNKRNKVKINKQVRVNQYKVTITDKSVQRDKRHYDRQIDQWTVRGHWRTTKLGKKVWIKAYVKGEGKGNVAPKEYHM